MSSPRLAAYKTYSPSTATRATVRFPLAGPLLAHYEVQMAGALLTALPPLVIYIALGRYFIRGLLAGALKG